MKHLPGAEHRAEGWGPRDDDSGSLPQGMLGQMQKQRPQSQLIPGDSASLF